MHKTSYPFQKIVGEEYYYTFMSIGDKGNIQKVIAFQPMNLLLYNVALLDYDLASGEFSDDSASNNYDLGMVFATIFQIVEDFLSNNVHYSVYIKANTEIKNKLYYRIIKNNLKALATKYLILGVNNDDIEHFDSTHKTQYEAFIIRLKS
jgi:hypothetical protein